MQTPAAPKGCTETIETDSGGQEDDGMTPARTTRMIPVLMVVCLLALPAPAQYSGGTGEPNDPYQIATAADLIALGETPDDYDKHFILTADIDLDPNLPGRKVFDRAIIAPTPHHYWDGGTPFTGVFDGDDHTISHLTIRGTSYLGLFGNLDSGAKILNLGIEGVDVNGTGYWIGGLVGVNDRWAASGGVLSGGAVSACYSTGTVCGDGCVGGLVGLNCGSVTNSYSSSKVRGGYAVGGLVGANEGTIASSHSTGTVGGSSSIGGLAGDNIYRIANSYSTAVTTGDSKVGGLVGNNYSYWEQPAGGGTDARIMFCYSTGAVSGIDEIGGLVGLNEYSITNCYSTGAVTGENAAGGLAGRNGRLGRGGMYSRDSYGTILNCYSTGSVSGGGDTGGLVGKNTLGSVDASFWDTQASGHTTSDGGTGLSTADLHDPNTFIEANWDFPGQPNEPHDIWLEPEDGGYPILAWQALSDYALPSFSGGTGEPDDPYLITSPDELTRIGHNPRLMTRHFKLMSDLDLNDFHFYPIGSPDYPYHGVFDGNGHVTSHLTIESESDVGLFGCLGDGAEIKNLGVIDTNITGSGDSVGGLVGSNGCPWSEGGSISHCYCTGAVVGRYDVGGLVGTNWFGSITASYSTTAVSGTRHVGGLVGLNFGNVICCYSTGTVNGDVCVGGLIGMYDVGHPTSCFWDTETSGLLNMCGSQVHDATGCDDSYGKTTAEMQTAATFLDAGWDFIGETENGTDDIWWILEGQDYPRLWWEAVEE